MRFLPEFDKLAPRFLVGEFDKVEALLGVVAAVAVAAVVDVNVEEDVDVDDNNFVFGKAIDERRLEIKAGDAAVAVVDEDPAVEPTTTTAAGAGGVSTFSAPNLFFISK